MTTQTPLFSGSIVALVTPMDNHGNIDFETLENNSVTLRNRDSMEQFRINIDDLLKYLNDKFLKIMGE